MYPSPKLLKSLLSSKPFPLLWWATDGRRNLWALGLILPVALGVFASAVGILMGPLLQIVQAPLDTRHAWTTILGPVWGTWAASYHGSTQVSGYDLLLLIPMTLVICVTGKALLTGLHWYLWEFMGELASKNLRLLLAQSHIGLRPEFRLTAEGQDIETHLSSAMTLDIRMMREFMVHYYGGLPREFFQALMLLGSLTLLSWRLTVLFIGVILPLGFAVRAIGKRIRRRAQDVLKHQSELTEWLQQRLMGIETIKHYQTESLEAEKFVAFNSQLSKKFARAIATKVRTSPTIELFATFAFVLVLVYSLEKIHTQTLSGSLFLSFFATLSLLSQSGSKLGRYYNSNKEGNEPVRRLKKLLKVFFDNQEMQNGSEERPEIDPSVVPKHLNPAVFTLYCHQLTVFYPGSSEPALRAITYGFLPGKIYCLKGASGSGKSTLFKALLGIIRPSSMGKTPMIGWGEALKKHPYPVSYMPQRFVPLNAPLFDHVETG